MKVKKDRYSYMTNNDYLGFVNAYNRFTSELSYISITNLWKNIVAYKKMNNLEIIENKWNLLE